MTILVDFVTSLTTLFITASLSLSSPTFAFTSPIAIATRRCTFFDRTYYDTPKRICGIAGRRYNINDDNDVILSASATESSADIKPSTSTTKTTFTSPTFKVYIEDTDAYGVLYNGNYIRSYERALSHIPHSSDGDEDRNNNNRWILSHITNQKFRSSPSLGEEYIIRGELGSNGANEDGVEIWQLEMVTKNNEHDSWIVHNSAQATINCHATNDVSSTTKAKSLDDDAISVITKGKKQVQYNCTPYHDEFDIHSQNNKLQYYIPLRSAMNYFERSRTNHLGGPDILRKMQVEDDILWVVTSVDDCKLFLDHTITTLEKLNTGECPHPSPGNYLTVQTNFVVKRRGMIIDCEHSLFMDVKDTEGRKMHSRLLAKATVSIMALKGSTHRPTSKLPQWVLDRFV